MSLWSRFRGRETRRATVAGSDPYLAEFFGMGGVGGSIDVDRAGGLATAQACISMVSQALASVPLRLHVKDDQGARTVADAHPLHRVLHDQFGPAVNAFEGREFLVASLMLHGNAYCRISWNGRGQAVGLQLLHARQVTAELLANGRRRYRVHGRDGQSQTFTDEEILHLRGRIGRDGVTGLSPIQEARETFATGIAQQDAAAKQAQKGFRPEGALVFPGMVGADRAGTALEVLRARIESNNATAGVHVFDGGVEWRPFSFSSKDSEFLAARGMTDELICRIFSVPPTAIGILTHGTFANVEQESRALVVRCLAPMARRIEQAMNAALLPEMSRQTLFIEHDLAGLLRGDMQARFESYRIGRNWGWLSANEIRRWENLPKIAGGDEYLVPLNMAAQGEQVVE